MNRDPIQTVHQAGHQPQPLRSILVVDADEDTRALYRVAFSDLGCDVVEASDGREALTEALVRPPTLVLTEIALPFVDGYALCEILRRDRKTADIPIVVVTAESRPAQTDRARRAGATVVLVKPTPIEIVVSEAQRLSADALAPRRRATAAGHSGPSSPDDPGHATSSTTQRHGFRTRSFARFTTTVPARTPPELFCPSCGGPLTYERSHIGGVNDRHSEQWDHYVCPASCGRFQYRHRTRKLRSVE